MQCRTLTRRRYHHKGHVAEHGGGQQASHIEGEGTDPQVKETPQLRDAVRGPGVQGAAGTW
ncbi:hypothetical protein E2C01_009373 [Portunus trituberculatus]|uniref:Uncharacterized protein n=1 Tax=Portunus trituberculatus TaxID=210409 RepID=A0A5B7D5H1_PORTR|nr:hypothetical protein [Portunus trituberculatus]